MLDCEKLVTKPAKSQTSTAPPAITSRLRARSRAATPRVSTTAISAIITSARKRP